MHPSKTVFLLCLGLIIALLPLESLELVYRRTGSKGTIESSVNISVVDQGFLVVPSAWEGMTTETLVAPSGETLRFTLSAPAKKLSYVAKREGNQLVLTGTRDGQRFEQRHNLDGQPWFQNWDMGIASRLKTGAREVLFWSLNPADPGQCTTFKAILLGQEPLTVLNASYNAQMMKVSLTGLMEGLWSMTYWLRPGDYRILKAEGTEGPFGAKMVTELIAERS